MTSQRHHELSEACKPKKRVPPVCFFAHFDPSGGIAPHVLHYISSLSSLGYKVIVASSGCHLTAEDVDAAQVAGAAHVVQRANRGIDFGAWQHLLREGHADGAPGVLLANDSVYGPFWGLDETLRTMTTGDLDAWGMVESNQGVWHLQSWFLHLSAGLLGSRAVRSVFAQPFQEMTKKEIIVRGELALSAALRAEQARWGAVHRHADAPLLARVASVNPMHLNWRNLISSHQIPFIKADLLRDNPTAIPWVNDWPRVVARQSDFPQEWIHEHLYRYQGRTPPRAGAPYRSPVRPISPFVRAFYKVASTDHAWLFQRVRRVVSQRMV